MYTRCIFCRLKNVIFSKWVDPFRVRILGVIHSKPRHPPPLFLACSLALSLLLSSPIISTWTREEPGSQCTLGTPFVTDLQLLPVLSFILEAKNVQRMLHVHFRRQQFKFEDDKRFLYFRIYQCLSINCGALGNAVWVWHSGTFVHTSGCLWFHMLSGLWPRYVLYFSIWFRLPLYHFHPGWSPQTASKGKNPFSSGYSQILNIVNSVSTIIWYQLTKSLRVVLPKKHVASKVWC